MGTSPYHLFLHSPMLVDILEPYVQVHISALALQTAAPEGGPNIGANRFKCIFAGTVSASFLYWFISHHICYDYAIQSGWCNLFPWASGGGHEGRPNKIRLACPGNHNRSRFILIKMVGQYCINVEAFFACSYYSFYPCNNFNLIHIIELCNLNYKY